ncbi:hypothetical protein RAZWK3B_01470 [Roseobacter sp. AzwK-3b]|uniref:hypothetical protein n=1 Tax=Roseobacter sp. AzwK-3b TaxID=351016 RepID=UPI0001568CD5|nr:hypothetical protein [Roseobacter sp. AzwK-3b]EDM72848.1 hypothetical protein RAZWK3B_01470 [Roseobacter sp. AzwK-3b]
MANLTIVTATKPTRLSKGFQLDDNGLLKTLPGGNLVTGAAEVKEIASLQDLAAILKQLTSANALIYGVPINEAARVVTRKMFADAGSPAGVTTRTNDAFRWPEGPGVLMLDYDPPNGGDPLACDELVGEIRAAAPGLADAAMLWWSSASSCIWAGDKELRGVRGQRLYILSKDAKDIPRAGQALFDRLWLAGRGYIKISKCGSLLPRTDVDSAVWQPSRFDFAGGAACAAGLDQRRGAPVIIPGAAQIIDTAIALPPLTPDEREKVSSLKAAAKSEVEQEAASVRDAWVLARVHEMLTSVDREDPEKFAEAERIARQALEASVLAGDFVVPVEVNSKIEMVSVAKLLKHRDRYHGALTLDPLEPAYDGGRLVGRLYLKQARPVLHSFARGGRTFNLQRAPVRVQLVKGRTAEAATETLDLLRNDPVVFDFGGQLVLVDKGRPQPLCEHTLAHHLGSVAQYWRATKKGDVERQNDEDPPATLLKMIISLGERRGLKQLEGVITAPTIRLDGSVLDTPGYDSKTKLLYDPGEDDGPKIPVAPTIAEAHEALAILLEPFKEFPFVTPQAKGALLGALLTAAVRPVLPTSPAFGFDAPIQGSGKTLLASCIGALTEGRSPEVWPHTQGRDDEETRKRLFTALRGGKRVLVWDNVVGTLDSASMASFITSEAMADRVLGKSESIRIPNRAMLILTGNNLCLAGDLPRRVIISRIDPETDQPFAREFACDPLEYVLQNRVKMLAAACTLIRARYANAKERAPGRLASFEGWDDLVRQTVVWVDTTLEPMAFGDPMDLIRAAQAEDPVADALFALLDALKAKFDDSEFNAKDVQAASEFLGFETDLASALRDIGGDRARVSVKSIGKILKYREGRIIHGLRLTGRHDPRTNTRVYRVISDRPDLDAERACRHDDDGCEMEQQNEKKGVRPWNMFEGLE